MSSGRVAVIGGGPAGCSAALRCLERGLRVTLFEASAPGRPKACGDALIPSALFQLARFGLNDAALEALGGAPFDTLGFGWIGDEAGLRKNACERGWTLRRSSLDQALRDRVTRFGGGACDVQYCAPVASIIPERSGVTVCVTGASPALRQYEAVILATGANSHLAARLGLDGDPERGVSIRGYGAPQGDVGTLAFELVRTSWKGYRWAFPVCGALNLGVCCLTRSPGFAKREAAARMRALLRSHELEGVAGGVETYWSGRGRVWRHEAGIVSCGDCAGLIDPATGEGITAALMSGDMAATSIADYLLSGTGVKALSDFSARVLETFRARYEGRPDTLTEMFHAKVGGIGF